ncbi:MAG: hypothetical protein JJT81_10995 [Rubellimicrobium sp.]|nr:hypothetical protein [Rubellimicrobium sp.]
MGWQIVKHSLSMLFRNLGNALKVSVGPILLAILLSTVALALTGISPEALALSIQGGVLPPGAIMAFAFVFVVMIFTFAWVAVAWHRFILLEEYPGILPALGDRPIWAYAGRSLGLGLLMLLVMLPVILISGSIVGIFGSGRVVGAVMGFGVGLVFTFLWLRLALILPAIAVGKPMKLAESWSVTRDWSGHILNAAAILVVLNVMASLVTGILGFGIIGMLAELAISWITLMAGTSILTTLYGILVEKRALPA